MDNMHASFSSNEDDQNIPESPKPMAFTIDFGGGKSVDTQRHKTLVEKYKKRHRRGQSLPKLEDSPQNSTNKKHPSSANLPHKSQTVDKKTLNNVKLRESLSLPLKHVNNDRMTQSCTLPNIDSPEVELRDILTPDLDSISPYSPKNDNGPMKNILLKQLSSPECELKDDEKFVDGKDFDFDKSDAVSDAGTYTLDADNYSEEQKARMSIDKDFKIEEVSVYRKTQEYIQSLANVTEMPSPDIEDQQFMCRLEKPKSLNLAQNNAQMSKTRLSPIVSPTQNFSITQNYGHQESKCINKACNQTFSKVIYPSPKAKTGIGSERALDHGNVISVTSSGAFRSHKDKGNSHLRRLSLTKSEVQVQAYTDNSCTLDLHQPPDYNRRGNLSANLVLVSENLPKNVNLDRPRNGIERLEEVMHTNVPVGKIVNLPPAVGGITPTKIPSPIHSSRSRSRNSSNSPNLDLSDSSLETESYLKPTQNLLNSLQQRLSLDSDHESDHDTKFLNNDARNLLKKPTHMRHNSLDDRNIKISNKLEHFQNKNFIDQTYTKVLNQYSHNKVHKIQNSPNNSPIRRSSSFSMKNQINTKCNISHKESNLQNSPSFARNGSIQRSSSTASIRPALLIRRSSINSDHKIDRSNFGDTESSSDDDLKQAKKKDMTTTRYNRAFSLRRARLDTEVPSPRCPNTPEMRRKFQPSEIRTERAISVDRRPIKSEVPSRYLHMSKTKPAPPPVTKVENKCSPKIGNVSTKPSPKPQVFARTDSGRFSMRSTKPPVTNSQKTIRKEFTGKKQSGPRSNSSLTSKEVDFQNWKRRKSYDPMKAAAEGKKRAEMAKKQSQNSMTQSYHESNQDCDSSPSHSSSVHRSQSFHGTAALERHYTSSEEEEDITLSADEGFSPPTPSPQGMSPKHVRYAWKD